MNKLTFQGQWQLPGKIYREFRVTLPSGLQANFTVRPGEDLKGKLAEVQKRFSQQRAA